MMKKIMVASLFGIMSTQSFGAIIQSAKLDSARKNILIDVVYSGGCGKHNFSIKHGICLESFPVQCSVELVHISNDICEAIVSETVVMSLASLGFSDAYYKGASVTIVGGNDWETGKPSKATIRLP